jgi:hypothetical protein
VAVDLALKRGKSGFEFVELKINNKTKKETPVFAAVEILVYSLLWLLSRRYRQKLAYAPDNAILNAKSLKLSVLAPRDFYCRYSTAPHSIDPFAQMINDGLRELSQQHGVKMKFCFTVFPASFTWDPAGRPQGNDLIALLYWRERGTLLI